MASADKGRTDSPLLRNDGNPEHCARREKSGCKLQNATPTNASRRITLPYIETFASARPRFVSSKNSAGRGASEAGSHEGLGLYPRILRVLTPCNMNFRIRRSLDAGHVVVPPARKTATPRGARSPSAIADR